jgi:hypothetical protein
MPTESRCCALLCHIDDADKLQMLAYFEKHLVFNQADEEEVNGNSVDMTGVDEDDI